MNFGPPPCLPLRRLAKSTVGETSASASLRCAAKGASPQPVRVPPWSWFAPPGSNQSGDRGNEVVGASGVEGHVQFCESLGVRFPGATHPILVCRGSAEQALEAFAEIAARMGLTINHEKTRITKLTAGFDFIGFQFVKRRSPTSGKPCIYMFPSKAVQRNIRRRIKYFTKRRAPITPRSLLNK
jgi:hypothetical protein